MRHVFDAHVTLSVFLGDTFCVKRRCQICEGDGGAVDRPASYRDTYSTLAVLDASLVYFRRHSSGRKRVTRGHTNEAGGGADQLDG